MNVRTGLYIAVFILLVLVITVLAWQFMPAFLPPFFGVLVAFLVQRFWQEIQDMKDRQKFLRGVKQELESCSRLLGGKGNLCPTDMWKSGISSGFLKLLSHEDKTELASIYFRLECHNYEAEKVSDVDILAAAERGKPQSLLKLEPVEKTGPAVISTYIELLLLQLSLNLKDSQDKLKADIDSLLKNK